MKRNKIKISFITPTKHIKKYGTQGDFILALSHLMRLDKVTEYEREIKKSGLPIILDNGLYENHVPEPLHNLIRKAIKVRATHFFAPDILYNKQETWKSYQETLKVWKGIKFNKPKIAVVPQATNSTDYKIMLRAFEKESAVDMVGLSILAIPRSFKKEMRGHNITRSRVYLLKWMKRQADRGYIWKKKYHLLGLGDSMKDVFYAQKHCPWVVSHDSSSAFWNGVQGRRMKGSNCQVVKGKTKVPVNFKLKNLTKKQEKLIQENINLIKTNLEKNAKSN